jgi:hypothetical protein
MPRGCISRISSSTLGHDERLTEGGAKVAAKDGLLPILAIILESGAALASPSRQGLLKNQIKFHWQPINRLP